MKRSTLLGLLILAAAVMTSCAPGANPSVVKVEEVAGFWLGLWHGLIALFTFIVSLFNDNVSIYEVANNGGWYNFGYLLGVMVFWGGGGGGASCGRK